MKNIISIDYENRIVTKKFRSRIACAKETSVLQAMAGTELVPEYLGGDEFNVIMSYSEGMTLSQLIDTNDEEKIISAFVALADYLIVFEDEYEKRTGEKIVLPDFNPRNFLYKDDKIIFIDFEAANNYTNTDNYSSLLAMVKNCRFDNQEFGNTVFMAVKERICSKCNIDYTAIEKVIGNKTNQNLLKINARQILNNTQGFVIAGGNSIRMGGKPKGLLPLNGFTFTDYVIYAMQIFNNVSLSANLPDYNVLALQTYTDSFVDIGPLSALYTALVNADCAWVFIAPCDMPFIDDALILSACQKADFSGNAVIYSCADKLYPTLGFYNKNILPIVEKQITACDYKLRNLLQQIDYQIVKVEDEKLLYNINTPEDYKKSKEIFNR